MNPPSELERLLRAEGRLESHGEFTVDAGKALEKLARYQLPFAGAWALKVVQAAVASGSPYLQIKQTHSETRFAWHPKPGWTLDVLEQAFVTPDPEEPALRHLMQGLRSVALDNGRPFRIQNGGTISLVWNGVQMTRDGGGSPVEEFTLTVLNRKRSEGMGVPGLRNIHAAQRNQEVSHALVERAFVAPLKLTLDGRRLDGLHQSLTHGFGPKSYPMAVGWKEEGAPTLALPPGTFETLDSPDARRLQGLWKTPQPGPACVAMAWMASAHFKPGLLEGTVTESILHWIRDGVVVDQELLPVPRAAVCLSLFVPAEDLAFDLSGFSLRADDARAQRRETACREAASGLQSLSLPELRSGPRVDPVPRGWGAVAVLAGAGLLFFGTPSGLFVLGYGASHLIASETLADVAQLQRELTDGLAFAQLNWRRMYSE